MALQLPGLPAAGSVAAWPRTAIHDSVAAIVRQHAYDRSLRMTLLERIVRWIGELFRWLDDALGGAPHARRIATVAVIALALIVLLRLVYAARLREQEGARRRRPLTAGRRTLADPWQEAERLAAQGQYTDAAHALYRAVVGLLARRGLLRPHPSKTSGDYARELRARGADAHAGFRQFGRRYERMLFGTGMCDAPGYGALLADARLLLASLESEQAA